MIRCMKGNRLATLALAMMSIPALLAKESLATPSSGSAPAATLSFSQRPDLAVGGAEYSARNPPLTMHMCIAHCFSLRWENGHYIRKDPYNTSIYTIDSFTRESVVLHRTDTGSFPLTAILRGHLSEAGDSITDGKITWTSGNHGEGVFRAAWGDALGSVPGSDEEARSSSRANAASATLSTPKSREPLVPSMSEPTSAIKSRRINLNGDWEGYFTSPMFAKTIRITQSGANITAESLNADLSPTGRPFFRGSYDPPANAGRVELAEYSGSGVPPNWAPNTLTVGDPDHFRIGNSPPFQRIITLSSSGDVPCEAGNPLNVQPHYELQRGKIAHTKKDFKSAVCWFYLAATAGESEAQGLLGAYFREGFHVEKNPSLAFYWTERSAEAGNASGAITLAALYEEGVGTPVNSSKAQFWRERSKLLQAQDNKEALAEQHAQTLQDQQLEALTRLAIVGAIVATDPGLPVPCKILTRRDSTPSQIDNAKAEIANHNLKCN